LTLTMTKNLILTPSNTDGIFHLAETFCVRAARSKAQWEIDLAEHYGKLAASFEHSGWKKITGMTQTDRILTHIRKAGSITQREAYIDYGIQSFHRRLTDLRDMGYTILGQLKTHPTTGQKYTRYFITGLQGVN